MGQWLIQVEPPLPEPVWGLNGKISPQLKRR